MNSSINHLSNQASQRELGEVPLEHQLPQAAELSSSTSRSKSNSIGFSRDEMNLAEFPLAVLSTRVDPKVKTLEFTDSHRLPNGEMAERKWVITGADKFGLPTSTDDDVVLGLMRLSMDKGFREQKIYFTRYELLKTLRWSTEGRSYQRLIKSLDRLSGVRIRSSNSFYDNQTKSYQTCNFGIIDAYEINDERGGRNSMQGEAPKSFFIWSEVLFDSFRAGFIKKLDLDFYFNLRSAVSRRLFRYLDKHFYYRSAIEMPLMTLAFEKLGLSRRYRYISSIKQQLEPAILELQEKGFLAGHEFNGKGALAKVRFYAKRAESSSQQAGQGQLITHGRRDKEGNGQRMPQGPKDSAAERLNDLEMSTSRLFSQLVSRGIVELQVRRLLKKRTKSELEKIEKILPYYDHLVASGDPKVSRNPVGFLYRAVERPEQFKLPKAFTEAFYGANKGLNSDNSTGLRDFKRNPRGRPELKIFNGERRDSQAGGAKSTPELDKQYQSFCESEFQKKAAELPPEALAEIYEEVESKTRILSDALSSDVLSRTIEACVRKEVLHRAGVPSLKDWLKSRSNS